MKLLYRLLAGGTLTAVLLVTGSASGSDLEHQLDIRPNNATQGQARNVADQWMAVGDNQAAQGEYERAIAAWEEASEIYFALGDMVAAGKAFDAMGLTYAQLGQFQAADGILRRRLAIARDNNDRVGEVYGLNNVGAVLIQDNQITAAKAAFDQALRIAQTIDHPAGIGLSLSNLGLIAKIEGNLDDAVKYLEAATNYRYQSRDYLGEANSSNTLGDVYLELGRLGSAIGAYRVGLEGGARAENVPVQLRSIDGLLAIYTQRGDLIDVRNYVDQRLALTANSQAPDGQTVRSLIWLGTYYELTDDPESAREVYTQALTLARSLDISHQISELVNRLMRL